MVHIRDISLGASNIKSCFSCLPVLYSGLVNSYVANSVAAAERAKLDVVLQTMLECSKQQEGPPPGLPNLGNTCFMNAVLQCLLNTPGNFLETSGRLLTQAPQDGGSATGCVASSSAKELLGLRFAWLLAEYGSKRGSSLDRSDAGPLSLVRASMSGLDALYGNGKQQDAYEFLGCFLEGLDGCLAACKDLTKVPTGGLVRSVCGVTSYSSRRCSRCQTAVQVDRTTSTSIGLPMISTAAQMDEVLRRSELESPVGLVDLLSAAQSPEVIEGYDCDCCRARAKEAGEAHERSTVTQRAGLLAGTGEVLVVALYRFVNALDDASGDFRPMKVRRRVEIPNVLPVDTGKYQLHGVVSHCGESLSSGHYVSAVRSCFDQRWYECNDARVTPFLQEDNCEATEFDSAQTSADPFILFYHRVPDDTIISI